MLLQNDEKAKARWVSLGNRIQSQGAALQQGPPRPRGRAIAAQFGVHSWHMQSPVQSLETIVKGSWGAVKALSQRHCQFGHPSQS